MGSMTDNLALYKPDNGETGWGDEVDANFDILDEKIRQVGGKNVKDYGATGWGVEDDGPAIQEALDDVTEPIPGIVYFPPGLYLIGTPLSPPEGIHWVGQGARNSVGAWGSMLKAKPPNTKIISCARAVANNRFDGMGFDGNTAEGRTDIAFWGGGDGFEFIDDGGIVNSQFIRCEFRSMLYDFYMSEAPYLINWQQFGRTDGPSFFSGGWMNDNHWVGCTWQPLVLDVPAVTINQDGGNYGQGNWFSHCYFENLYNSCVVFNFAMGGVRDTYIEGANLLNTTYETYGGATRPLPIFDVQNESVVELVDNFVIGLGQALYFGNTATDGPREANNVATSAFDYRTVGHYSHPELGSYPAFDASYMNRVEKLDGELWGTTRGAPGSASLGMWGTSTLYDYNPLRGTERGWTISGPDAIFNGSALTTNWFEIYEGDEFPDHLYNVVINSLSDATRGREVTFDFCRENGHNFGTITFGSAFKTTGAFTGPSADNTRRIIRFYYNGRDWIETFRHTTDVAVSNP